MVIRLQLKLRLLETTHPDYQQAVSDVYLFINGSSPYVGSNNFDDRYDKHLSGEEVKDIIGKRLL